MANPENKQIPYESTQKDIRDAIESVATAIGGIAVPSADHVSYDNSVSGLSATDVQNALDEIVSDIPTVNDGTLTIQQNGTSIGSFSANTASNVTANIKTPTADKKTATDQFSTADGGLLSKCMIDLVPVQSGSGDPSPDNVRPISGHTEVDARISGLNLVENVWVQGLYNTSDGKTLINNAYWVSQPNYYPIDENETFTISATIPNKVVIFFYDENKDFIPPFVQPLPNSNYSAITTPENAMFFRMSFNVAGAAVAITPNDVPAYKLQLEKGNEKTSYVEYVANDLYQVQIGSTVYGGYVDLVSGVMVATFGIKDLGLLNWSTGVDSISQYFYAGVSDIKESSSSFALPTAISEIYKPSPSSNVTDYSFAVSSSSQMLFVRDTSIVDVPTFVSRNTGYNIVYELDTPLTIQLTPQQIETLAGQNNLSTPLSGQSIETNGVEYKELFTFADVKEYVDKKIPDAPTTDGTYTLTAVVSGGVPTYSWV